MLHGLLVVVEKWQQGLDKRGISEALLTHLFPTHSFSIPLKTLENLTVFMFLGCRERVR